MNKCTYAKPCIYPKTGLMPIAHRVLVVSFRFCARGAAAAFFSRRLREALFDF